LEDGFAKSKKQVLIQTKNEMNDEMKYLFDDITERDTFMSKLSELISKRLLVPYKNVTKIDIDKFLCF
jgi:hypothetical protein